MPRRKLFVPALLAVALFTVAQASLQDDLVAYWPLDDIIGGKTPDLIGGYDLEAANLTVADVVPGRVSRAIQFDNARQTMLLRINNPGEQLPINQHPALTIAFWAQVNGTGLIDLRLFSEGSTLDNNPLFNLGTANNGNNGTLDFFFRRSPWATVDHLRSVGEPLDGTWRHIAFVQQEDGSRALYIDGVLDPVEIPAKPEGDWNVNTTTIGGILRASPTHWLTGAMDEVMLWSRALNPAEVQQVVNEGLTSIFPPLTRNLVAYWPFDEVDGLRTPDAWNDYDLELVNLSAADLVPGRFGQAFQFDNARQTMLKWVAGPGDQLPINQHEEITIAFWANVTGTGLSDLRLFSEGSTTDNNPLFNLGTANTGTEATLDFYFRQAGWTEVNHLKSVGEPLDGTWRHIAFVQQADGARALYIDGELDPVEIPAKEPGDWRVNTTTIGGILRANPTHWLTGLMDDVALWNRALAPAEIGQLATTGMPEFTPPAPPPLAVRSFVPDLPAGVVGDTVTLRWDATKNVRVTIDQGVGDVTAQTVSGLGSITVPVTGTRTYTLTLSRAGETSVTAQTTVTAIDGVQPGWTLVDNFDRYEPGPIQQPGSPWADLTATGIHVTNLNGNLMALPVNAGTAAILQLRGLTIDVNQQRTLFCRVMVTDDDLSATWNGVVGVSDRPFRFGTDVNGTDIGPAVYCFDDFYPSFLGSVDGPGGALVAAPEPTIEENLSEFYNVWIDITNGPFPAGDPRPHTGDTFSIHVQKDGDATRTTIVDNYTSSRDPVGAADVGLTQEALSRLVIGGRTGMADQRNLLFDDIYISQDGFNATVPRAAGFSQPVQAADPPTLTFQPTAAGFSISWANGSLQAATTIDGDYATVDGATSPYDVTPAGQQQYYRVQGN